MLRKGFIFPAAYRAKLLEHPCHGAGADVFSRAGRWGVLAVLIVRPLIEKGGVVGHAKGWNMPQMLPLFASPVLNYQT